MTVSRIEQMCIDRGMKMTGQRRIIARVLSEAADHPDVEALHHRATAEDPRISIATVYRTVRLFEDAGILTRHDFGDGRARYEEVPEEHHDHLIDVTCGKVVEFHSTEIEELQHRIARQHGFRLVGHRLELFGVPLDDEAADAPTDAPTESGTP
ncbi:Fur family transcriptional regulator [Roseospirillum parvum]|nr:Fur family transcriptional regulator [Roseospirillum parvum]